jgi:hypothetical protein
MMCGDGSRTQPGPSRAGRDSAPSLSAGSPGKLQASEREAIKLADRLQERFGCDAPNSIEVLGFVAQIAERPEFVAIFDRAVCAMIREANQAGGAA